MREWKVRSSHAAFVADVLYWKMKITRKYKIILPTPHAAPGH
jgi:hypothetical protein